MDWSPPSDQEALLAAIVRSADEAIVAKTLDGTIVAWNPAAERMYGYSAAEALGQPISLIVPPDRPAELAQILDRIGRGERIDHFQTKRLAKDGRLLDVSVTISPVRRGDEIVGVSAITRDVTEELARHDQAQRAAVLLNDKIVQGLVVAKLALELGEQEQLERAIADTLDAARALVGDLLEDITVAPGKLRTNSE
jgi:PAS domain S-box-containing protein